MLSQRYYHDFYLALPWPGASLSLELASIAFPRHGGTFWQLLTENALVAPTAKARPSKPNKMGIVPKKPLRILGIHNGLFGHLLAIIHVFLNRGSEQLRISSAALTEDDSQYAEMIHLS